MKERIGTVLHWVGLILFIYTNGVGLFVASEGLGGTFTGWIFLIYSSAAFLFFVFFWSCNYILTGRTRILPWSKEVSKTIWNWCLGISILFIFLKVIGVIPRS
tara:strand:- start:305 stop:613 length:309 start_codon:yes stop_codon:yes gene_type:complete